MNALFLLQNRVYLLTVIGLVTTVAALGPFFLEEITPRLVAHVTLHIAAITFSVFLTIISGLAYISTRNANMIWTMLAFLTFTLLSIFLLEEDISSNLVEHDETVIIDVLLTVMIGFFAISVFSNQRFPTRKKYN